MVSNNNPRIRVAGVFIENKKILLIEHKKKDKKYWLIPGGGVEWGESTAEALIREYKEETNLDIVIEKFLFLSETIAPNKEKHVINLYFMVKRNENFKSEIKLGNEENLSDLKFLSEEEIENIKLYPNIKDKIIKLLNEEDINPYLGLLWDK